jgi:hypothetical protein
VLFKRYERLFLGPVAIPYSSPSMLLSPWTQLVRSGYVIRPNNLSNNALQITINAGKLAFEIRECGGEPVVLFNRYERLFRASDHSLLLKFSHAARN